MKARSTILDTTKCSWPTLSTSLKSSSYIWMLSFVCFIPLFSQLKNSRCLILFSFATPLMSQRRFPFSFDLRWSVKMSNINQNFEKKKRKCVCTICAISQTGTPTLKQWLNQWCDVVWLELKLTFTAGPAFPAPPMKRHRLTGVNAQRERDEEPAMRGTGSGLLLLLQRLFWMAQLIWIGPDKLSPAGAERAKFSLSLSVGCYAVTVVMLRRHNKIQTGCWLRNNNVGSRPTPGEGNRQ